MKYVQVFLFFISFIVRVISNNKSSANKTEDHFARIVGGYRPKTYRTARYIVSLRYGTNHGVWGSNHFCGGSILSERIVLTAAHCVLGQRDNRLKDKKRITVVVGSTDRLIRTGREQSLQVSKVIPHPGFDRETGFGDIALLQLKGDIDEDGVHVQRLQLTDDAPKQGQECTLLGWGDIIFNGPSADELVFMDVTVLPFWHCAMFAPIVKEVICAGEIFGPQKIAANGDSGGPLICNGTLVGVASYVVAIRTYFTSVYHFREWIKANSKNGSLKVFKNSCYVTAVSLMCNLLFF